MQKSTTPSYYRKLKIICLFLICNGMVLANEKNTFKKIITPTSRNETPFLPRTSKKQAAWTRFRKAFLTKDFTKLILLTDFPLVIYGTLDEDPIIKVWDDKFETCFSKIYQKDTGIGDGLNHERFIKQNSSLDTIVENGKPISAYPEEDGFRIGDLKFGKKPFLLQRIYLDTTDPLVLKACKK